MKHEIQSAIKQVTADRAIFLIILGLLLGGAAYIVYVAFNLHTSDLQLATRFTSFGETHFYREKWWYLLSFIGFGLLFLIAHIGMLIKLYATGMKQLAFAFGYLSGVVLIIAFVYTYQVFGIAYLN